MFQKLKYLDHYEIKTLVCVCVCVCVSMCVCVSVCLCVCVCFRPVQVCRWSQTPRSPALRLCGSVGSERSRSAPKQHEELQDDAYLWHYVLNNKTTPQRRPTSLAPHYSFTHHLVPVVTRRWESVQQDDHIRTPHGTEGVWRSAEKSPVSNGQSTCGWLTK